jgi:hypothetical protein
LWLETLEECNLTVESLTQPYDLNQKLPWENIDMGLGVHFLKAEYQEALGLNH